MQKVRMLELSLNAAASSQRGGEPAGDRHGWHCSRTWLGVLCVCKGTHTLSPHTKRGFLIKFTDG